MDNTQAYFNERAQKMAASEALRSAGTIGAGGMINNPFTDQAVGRPERELQRLCAMLDRAETTLDCAIRELISHLGRISGENAASSGAAGTASTVAGQAKPGECFHDAHLRAEQVAMLAERLRDQIMRLDAI